MSSEISFTPAGRIEGIDGVLDQISESVAKQVVPIVRDTVLPIIQRDKELQKTVGEAIGRGALRALVLPLFFISGALGMIAYTYWRNSNRPRSNPSSSRRSRWRTRTT